MKILTAKQTRDWDAYTIKHEPIASIELMERASQAFVIHALPLIPQEGRVVILAGPGNNGGDALAIGRMLRKQRHYLQLEVYALDLGGNFSTDFQVNEGRLSIEVGYLRSEQDFPKLSAHDWVIDGVFGSGLSRPASGLPGQLIEHVNQSEARIISIDIASGLYGDAPTPDGGSIMRPRHTITFQSPALALLAPENESCTGTLHIADIGLLPEGAEQANSPYRYTQADQLPAPRVRPKFGHKGTFGHALLVAGSYGKLGAAYLASLATLRMGAGLLTVHLPQEGNLFMQISLPEAMCSFDPHSEVFSHCPEIDQYQAIGVGPGLGKSPDTKKAFRALLKECKRQNKPTLIDADAINMIGEDRELLEYLPKQTVLTPHPKEFERLVGEKAGNSFERWEQLRAFCQKYHTTVTLKGAHTAVGLPSGEVHFNTTGTPNMATAGSGDVLSGVVTSLLAQGYSPKDAAILGVYVHGKAGEIGDLSVGGNGLLASEIANELPHAWEELEDMEG